MTGYSVYYSNRDETAAKGFGKVAHLPCIFDSRPGYHRLGSEYLIDRGLGLWHPNLPRTHAPTRAPTEITIRSYAHWLANFLEWADRRGVDIHTCTFHGDVHGRYQDELEKGYWSRDGQGLEATTVNLYVDIACDFLTWLSYKGKRSPFDVPTKTVVVGAESAVSSRGHRGIEVQTREGKATRQNKARLSMPPDDAVRTWLEAVYKKFGDTKGLMCEAVLLTAMRRSEMAAFRLDTLPLNPNDWHISNPTALPADQLVRVDIKFATKGPGHNYDHGDKIGPERTILIPLHLANRLHKYREKVRPQQVLQWVKGVRGAAAQKARLAEAVHLFRDPRDGGRMTSRLLYEAWTGVPLPFKGWSPHLGRDWWACSVLWREIKVYEHAARSGEMAPRDIARFATDVIRLHIQPQLGHKREETSLKYLQWAMDMLGVALPQQYIRHLDAEEETAIEHSDEE